MPYINADMRAACHENLAGLSRLLIEQGGHTGLFNYMICVLGLACLYGKDAEGYQEMSAVRAAMLDAADEWYRKLMVPYEDQKCEENGEVFRVYL